jgi:outer membrane receptor for ferrienterochelin and colicins
MRSIVLFIFILFVTAAAVAQKNSDANIFGHVKSGGEHLPFITIVVKGTTIGTSTDATGHYWLVNLPEGKHTIRAQGVGYKPSEVDVIVVKGVSKEVDFELEEDILMLEQVVVSASRFNIDRSQTPVIINVISPKLFDAVQAVSLSEGLSFTPGLRVETNCQNCGFTQLRMNGLDGAYSQILINSRPIFGSLAGVYGLEQIPANMVDRVEVIRGGGSALFGGSAIAGTVNIITKDPINNTFHVGSSLSIIDGSTPDASINFNASIITDDRKSGIYIFGVNRTRTPWDANDDGFSEITKLKGNTLGFKAFHRPSSFSRVTVDFNSIGEFRRGGNGFDLLPHQADLSEQLDHRILTGGASYELYLNDYKQKFSVYASAQSIARDSYYGAGQDPNAYGQTQQSTFIGGLQYAHDFTRFLFSESTLTAGAELTTDDLIDEKLSSQNTNRLLVNDQNILNAGFYAQNQWNFGRLKFLLGIRADKHNLLNDMVLNPRSNFLFNLTDKSQLRLSYARGFRAPQLFDEDLHIELAGAQALRRENSPNLRAEVSNSISGSYDYTGEFGQIQSYLLVEGFYTFLSNAFVTNIDIDNNGLAYLLKSNGSGARVFGGNAELQLAPSQVFQLQVGFTLQRAKYMSNEVLWEPVTGAADSLTTTRNILRTPNGYGYFVTTLSPIKNLSFSLNGTYTGSMFTSHMVDPATSYTVVKQTPQFLDTGFKVSYSFRVTREVLLQFSGGMQNLFNSFQSDLDSGMYRDASYFYGPSRPRTILFSVKVGSL